MERREKDAGAQIAIVHNRETLHRLAGGP
jgi:hypothetical protein